MLICEPRIVLSDFLDDTVRPRTIGALGLVFAEAATQREGSTTSTGWNAAQKMGTYRWW